MRKKIVCIFLLSIFVLGIFIGCSKKSSQSSLEAEKKPTNTTDVESSELKIFTEEWPPMSFVNKDSGKPDGYGVEVVREILKREKMADTIEVVPWARGYEEVTTKPNIGLFMVTRTEERDKLFTMIGPVATGRLDLYAKKGTKLNIKSLEDAKKVGKIGVTRNAVEEQILIKNGFTNLEQVSTPNLSAKKLLSDRIDLWITSNTTINTVLKEEGYTYSDVEPVFTVKNDDIMYIAVSKGTDKKIINNIKSALEDMKKDGSFAKIHSKWFPNDTPPSNVEIVGVQ